MKNKTSILIYTFVIMGVFLMLTFGCKKDSNSNNTVTDKDGNVYNTVTIGTQVWMKENLKTTKYRDGTSIPNETDNTAWYMLRTGAYCEHDNSVSYSETYGRLYNWYAATNVHNICPVGWHLPTDAEWTILTTYLLGESVAGGKLNEVGTTHWESPNTDATNETGFTALPGGCRTGDGTFQHLSYFGHWWTATEKDATYAWDRITSYNSNYVTRNFFSKPGGKSIRCVKD